MINYEKSLADLHWHMPGTCPPRVQILLFLHVKFWNITALGIHAPLWGPCPPMRNPGSTTENVSINVCNNFILLLKVCNIVIRCWQSHGHGYDICLHRGQFYAYKSRFSRLLKLTLSLFTFFCGINPLGKF